MRKEWESPPGKLFHVNQNLVLEQQKISLAKAPTPVAPLQAYWRGIDYLKD
jgi:hypothetical protein